MPAEVVRYVHDQVGPTGSWDPSTRVEDVLRDDVPSVFVANFATALLAAQNVSGCLGVLAQLKAGSHPAFIRIEGAIERWQSAMSLWQRIRQKMGTITVPIRLDFRLGDLE